MFPLTWSFSFFSRWCLESTSKSSFSCWNRVVLTCAFSSSRCRLSSSYSSFSLSVWIWNRGSAYYKSAFMEVSERSRVAAECQKYLPYRSTHFPSLSRDKRGSERREDSRASVRSSSIYRYFVNLVRRDSPVCHPRNGAWWKKFGLFLQSKKRIYGTFSPSHFRTRFVKANIITW